MTPLEATHYMTQLRPHQRFFGPAVGDGKLRLLRGGKSEVIECEPGMHPVVLPDGLISEEVCSVAEPRQAQFRAALEKVNERYAPALRRLAE